MANASQKTDPPSILVGLLMAGNFGAEVSEGIQEELEVRRLAWNMCYVRTPETFTTTARWMLRAGTLAGAITYYCSPLRTNPLRRARVPLVCLNADREGYASRPGARRRTAYVEMDFEAIARAALDHLVSRARFRSGGYVECHWDYDWSRLRGDAVMAEFARRGIAASRFLHYNAPSRGLSKAGPDFAGTVRWLRSLKTPAAVVAANDATAVDVMRLCAAAGLDVPRDIAVLGMDDDPVFCRYIRPGLSSVHFAGRKAGRLAAGALADMLAGAPPPRAPRLYGAASIAARGSTATPSAAGNLVQRAIDYIDAHACDGATLADVVRHCYSSRSLLTLRFRQFQGQSVGEALDERRFREVRHLLRHTSLNAEQISARCGFESARTLRRAFQRAHGATLSAWRAAARAGKMPH